jgi:hypothetical protein
MHQTLLADIPVNFGGSAPGALAVTDFAMAEIEGKTLAVFASGSDNEVAMVDMANPTRVTKLALTSSNEASGAEGEGRSVEWALGTEYVWVTGSEAKELYVIRIPGGKIERAIIEATIEGIDATALVFVENYRTKAAEKALETRATLQAAEDSTQERQLAIAGLVISCIALMSSSIMFVVGLMSGNIKSASMSERKVSEADRWVDNLEVAAEEQPVDMKSLGSKQVN